MRKLLSLLFTITFALASASSWECTNSGGACINKNVADKCLDASAFERRVATFDYDESVLPLLRGTIGNIASKEDVDFLHESLPMSDLIVGWGYGEDRIGGHPALAGLGLEELSTSHERRYVKLLKLRERIRSATEGALGLCPGTLLIHTTAIAQKTLGGTHGTHADNCYHYFDETTKRATCDPSKAHPYPKRVAASIFYLNDPSSDSGNFIGGEFYFANRRLDEAFPNEETMEEIVPVESGKMIYFTSGTENLHGALGVKQRADASDRGEPRRLALAIWYVFEQELQEYVPPFRGIRSAKSRQVYDRNDPTSPETLFSIPIPLGLNETALRRSIEAFIVSRPQSEGSWKVYQYFERTLHVLFKDHSAMIALDFEVTVEESMPHVKSSIILARHKTSRKNASLEYAWQESALLHGILDEISGLVDILAEDEIGRQYFNRELEKARNRTESASQAVKNIRKRVILRLVLARFTSTFYL